MLVFVVYHVCDFVNVLTVPQFSKFFSRVFVDVRVAAITAISMKVPCHYCLKRAAKLSLERNSDNRGYVFMSEVDFIEYL